MTACTLDMDSRYLPNATGNGGSMVELTDLGRRMVRDLERFLSVELPKPRQGTLLRGGRRTGQVDSRSTEGGAKPC